MRVDIWLHSFLTGRNFLAACVISIPTLRLFMSSMAIWHLRCKDNFGLVVNSKYK